MGSWVWDLHAISLSLASNGFIGNDSDLILVSQFIKVQWPYSNVGFLSIFIKDSCFNLKKFNFDCMHKHVSVCRHVHMSALAPEVNRGCRVP